MVSADKGVAFKNQRNGALMGLVNELRPFLVILSDIIFGIGDALFQQQVFSRTAITAGFSNI